MAKCPAAASSTPKRTEMDTPGFDEECTQCKRNKIHFLKLQSKVNSMEIAVTENFRERLSGLQTEYNKIFGE